LKESLTDTLSQNGWIQETEQFIAEVISKMNAIKETNLTGTWDFALKTGRGRQSKFPEVDG